jgi:endosialidase-like protein
MKLLSALLLLLFTFSSPAFAACTGPAGNEGDVDYSGVQHMMAYCNGTNWISMGANAAIAFSGLTTNDFCTATSGTSIGCNTGSTGTGSVVLAASPSMTSPTVSSGGLTITAGGITVSAGGANITGTVTGTSFSGSGASLTSIGTSNMTAITGSASATTFLAGNGTWSAVTPTFSGLTSGDFCTASGTTAVVCSTGSTGTGSVVLSASPTLTGTITAAAANFSGNVGIGTTSPVVSFQAGTNTGAFNSVGIEGRNDGVNIDGVGAANWSRIGGFYASNPIPGAAIGFAAQGGSGQSGALEFLTKAQNDNTTQPSVKMVIDESGNVGIGTATPGNALQVYNTSGAQALFNGWSTSQGAAHYNATILLGDKSAFQGFLDFQAVTASVLTVGNTDTAGSIAFKVGGTQAATINSSGNVGIGIASPLGRLDVQGATARTGTTPTAPAFYVSGTLNDGKSGPASGNIEFRHDNGTQGIGFGYNTIYQTGSNTNQDLNLLSRGSSPITLNAYGYSTGNVGIGNTSPPDKLFVTGRTDLSEDGQTECCAGDWTLALSEWTSGSGRVPSIQFHAAGASEGYIRLAGSGTRRFQIGDNQGVTTGLQMSGALSVDGTGSSYIQGNVGIGATSPSYKLDVGGAGATGSASRLGGISILTADSGYEWWTGSFTATGPWQLTHRKISDSTWTNAITVNTSNNVGIGLYSGLNALVTAQGTSAGYASNVGLLALQTPGSTNGFRFGILDGNYAWMQSFNSLPLVLNPGGNNVGIGTLSPNDTLAVAGNAAPLNLRDSNTSAGKSWEVGPDDSNNFVVYNQNGTGMWMADGGTSWIANSDIRLKKNIRPIGNALEKLALIHGVTFQWKDSDTTTAEQVGVIAQDVEKAFPQLVSENSKGFKGVNYSGLVAPLIEAVQELKADNDNLRAANDNFAAERAVDAKAIEELRREVAELRREVHAQ